MSSTEEFTFPLAVIDASGPGTDPKELGKSMMKVRRENLPMNTPSPPYDPHNPARHRGNEVVFEYLNRMPKHNVLVEGPLVPAVIMQL